jgi:hypothetical protein
MKAGGSSAKTKRPGYLVPRYSTGYKTARFLSRFVAGQISLEQLTVWLSVGGGPTGFRKDLCPQIFSELSLFYLKLYLMFFGIDRLSRWQHYSNPSTINNPMQRQFIVIILRQNPYPRILFSIPVSNTLI